MDNLGRSPTCFPVVLGSRGDTPSGLLPHNLNDYGEIPLFGARALIQSVEIGHGGKYDRKRDRKQDDVAGVYVVR
jgi:hypothetical protein